MTNYEKRTLNHLIDKYERSKSFLGKNKVNQRFTEKIKKLYPKYSDLSEYELFGNINDAIEEIQNREFISIDCAKNVFEKSVILNTNKLDEIYAFLNRKPKAELHDTLFAILEEYQNENAVLNKYCSEQISRLKCNKSVERFDGDVNDFENTLKAVKEIYKVTEETFERDFSVRLYNDSKVFEKIRNKVARILFQYGDFPKEETVLEDMNIVKNPGHVYLKGKGIITIKEQMIDLSVLKGDIAVSSIILKDIDDVKITGNKLITVENLTTFNRFNDADALIVYLGGFHNTHRRNLIKMIHKNNQNIDFLHYGDIDAGGFYILLHLRKKTGIDFKPFRMDTATLKQYKDLTKSLTENDKKRLNNLLSTEFRNTVEFMLENN